MANAGPFLIEARKVGTACTAVGRHYKSERRNAAMYQVRQPRSPSTSRRPPRSTPIASMEIAANTTCSGRLAQPCISSTTVSVIRATVPFEMQAPTPRRSVGADLRGGQRPFHRDRVDVGHAPPAAWQR